MTTSAIGSLTALYQPQSTNSISPTANHDSDGDNDGSRVSGSGGRHHGGGAFLQNIIQSLQSLGVNVPGASGSGVSPVSGTSSTGNAVQSTASPSDARQVLHAFLHDLHQALNQAGGQQPSATTDNDGDHDNSGSSSTGSSNGYNNFSTKLQSLISSLTNDNSSSSTGTSTSNADTTLQTDFSNLVNSLGGSSASSSPTLLSFLQQLASNSNNGNSPQNGISAILKTQA